MKTDRRGAVWRGILKAALWAVVLGGASGILLADAAVTFTPAPGAQGERREVLMTGLHREPYPKDGAWRFVGLALSSYWVGDNASGDKAIMQLAEVRNQVTEAEDAAEVDNGFHWQAYELERVVLLFGRQGVFKPGAMSAEAEGAAKEVLWKWLKPRARRVLVEPAKDWWLWGSENHHLQAWSSMWGALRVLAGDPAYVGMELGDGSTVGELKGTYDAYFKRWIRERATRGIFAECNSPTYGKYSLAGFYNLVDFSDDAELRRLAGQFLDLCWAQWALEQIDGIRAGSRHRSYPGVASILSGSDTTISWYHFGVGEKESVHPSAWCAATSGYAPPEIVARIVRERALLGNYEIRSRQPGASAWKEKAPLNYVTDPSYAMYAKQGVYSLDPECRDLLRVTYATPDFILGSTMLPARKAEEWSLVSSQNRWDGVIFAGKGNGRIFVQPRKPARGSVYNAQWNVQDRGVLLVQGLNTAERMEDERIWLSNSLERREEGGWIFVTAPQAYAAIRVMGGETAWEADAASFWHEPGAFKEGLGEWLVLKDKLAPIVMEVAPKGAFADEAAFQAAILRNPLRYDGKVLEYRSAYYQTTLTLYADYSKPPLIGGKPVEYNSPKCFDGPYLQGEFGGTSVTLSAFGERRVFDFK